MIYTFTLAYNLPSEVEIATVMLYQQNKDCEFKHLIVDLGFPMEDWNSIPDDISKAKGRNSLKLIETASKYGSQYVKMPNIGVSQNWEQVRKYLNVGDDDVMICVDPDERPRTDGWLKAINDVLMNGHKLAVCCLIMEEQRKLLVGNVYKHSDDIIEDHAFHIMKGIINWAQCGISGYFLNLIGGMPTLALAPIYGWIETSFVDPMMRLDYKYCILNDFVVEHYPCPPLYGEWKVYITSDALNRPQISFEEYLNTIKATRKV